MNVSVENPWAGASLVEGRVERSCYAERELFLEFRPAHLTHDQARLVADEIYRIIGEAPAAKASEISFNEAALRLAIVHKATVTFRYAKGDGSVIETRSLTPLAVDMEANIVLGDDPDRDDDIRAFRLDRIKGRVKF